MRGYNNGYREGEEALAPGSTWHHHGTTVGIKEKGAMNSSHKDKFGRDRARKEIWMSLLCNNEL
jgi:hypothetical protein